MSLNPISTEKNSLSQLIRELFRDLSELIQQHIELVKVEIREESKRLGKAAVFGFAGLLFFQGVMVFVGLTVIAALYQAHLSLLASTAITATLFIVFFSISIILCIQQVKSAQALLKSNTDIDKPL